MDVLSLTEFRMQVARWEFYLSQRLERNRLVGCFISHRFLQMNRSLSANRESRQRRTGPSPFPSPEGRGVITEIPLWLIINT